MKTTLSQKILAGFISCTVILIAVAIFSFRNSEKFIDTNQWVNHTHEVLYEFDQVLNGTIDGETGIRGFVITGNDAFLEPYNSSVGKITTHLNKLRTLTSDNPTQQRNIEILQKQIDSVNRLRETIIALRKSDFAKARDLMNTGVEKKLQDGIRTTIAECRDIENTLLVERKKTSDDDAHSFNTIFIILLLIIGTVLVVVYFIISSNLKALKKAEQESANKNWILAGNVELNEKVRGEKEVRELAQAVIEQLCTYLKVQIGAFYIYENEQLYLGGTYAFHFRKNNTNIIKVGEGLVGQVALEKKTIVFTEVPADYIKINSGLGNAVPKNILLLPLLQDGVLKGVLELGSAKEFTELDIEFLNLAGENLAIVINAAQSRTKLKELLEETQRQAEELETQQEELKQSNEELQEKTILLEKSEGQLA